MTDFGGITGEPIAGGVPGTGFSSTFKRPKTYLNLSEYAMWLGLSESAIYGIHREGDVDYGCDDWLWGETTRYQMLRAIQQAESSLETYLKHPLLRRYFCDEAYRFTGCQFSLRRGHVLGFGNPILEELAVNVPTGVGVLSEEYELEVTVPDGTLCKDIVVFYPGQTRWEILPSKVQVSGTSCTLTIPRARLLLPELLIDYPDQASHPSWEDADNFLSVVDVYQRFPDETNAILFVWRRNKCGCGADTCLHTSTNPGDVITQTGAGVVVDARLGLIRVEPAEFNTETGEWDSVPFTEGRAPDGILINYVAGINEDCEGNCLDDINPELVRAIIALAHSNLPRANCSCGPANVYYAYDNFAPKPDEGPTILSPFGVTRGQNLAWQIVKRNATGMGGLFA